MRILHYLFGLPPVYGGGLVNYALDLAGQQAQDGDTVTILIPGEWNRRKKGKIHNVTAQYRKLFRDTPAGAVAIYALTNPLPVSYGKGVRQPELYLGDGESEVYREFLRQLSPDLIHVHSLMGLHQSFLLEARRMKIPVVFTTHDYYGLCPLATLTQGSKPCEEPDWGNCYDCCAQALTVRQLKWQHSDLYRALKNNPVFHKLEYSKRLLPIKRAVRGLSGRKKIQPEVSVTPVKPDARTTKAELSEEAKAMRVSAYEELRQYYDAMFSLMTYFHFNSTQTQRIYQQRLRDCPGEVLPVSGRNIRDRRQKKTFDGKLRIGYLGGAKIHKGYQELFLAADRLWEQGRQDFALRVYGNFPEEKPYLEKREPYRSEQLGIVFGEMDVLVAPSLWRETFGLVVLEALSFGVPVIVSPCVGARDVLGEARSENNDGIIREYGVELSDRADSLCQNLAEIYDDREILREINRNICTGAFTFWSGHAEQMKELYRRAEQKNKHENS